MDYVWFLFGFEGRINRAKYWLAGLIMLCWMFFALMLLAGIAKAFGLPDRHFAIGISSISASFNFTDAASKASPFPRLVTIPLTAMFAWIYVASAIKRLHDRDKRGWWIVPLVLAPGLFGRFEDQLGDSCAATVFGLAALILYVWGFIELGGLKGTRGTNRFGPDALAPLPPEPHAASHWDQQSALEFVPYSAGPPAGTHVKRGHD
jgi:uncharacterized membrane protein YhaH (DUF805 family)